MVGLTSGQSALSEYCSFTHPNNHFAQGVRYRGLDQCTYVHVYVSVTLFLVLLQLGG